MRDFVQRQGFEQGRISQLPTSVDVAFGMQIVEEAFEVAPGGPHHRRLATCRKRNEVFLDVAFRCSERVIASNKR